MQAVVHKQLDRLNLSPNLRTMLGHTVRHDMQELADSHHWDAVVPTIATLLHVEPCVAEVFGAAWRLCYATISRLDHLQDGDLIHDSRFATLTSAMQYQLVFSQYLFATSFLDNLDSNLMSCERSQQLRQLWTTTLFRVAGGQEHDLAISAALQPPAGLESYQTLIHQKAGALFALAFAGTALLANPSNGGLIHALYAVGDLYGALVQYIDDLTDAAEQPNRTATLVSALVVDRPELEAYGEQAAHAFFESIYGRYYQHASHLLSPYAAEIRDGVLGLFQASFGHPRNDTSSTPW